MNKIKYGQTKSGIVSRLYNSIVQIEGKRGRLPLSYTRLQFSDWFWRQDNAHLIYKEWVENDFDLLFRPHIARRNYTEGFDFSNIFLTRNKEYAPVRRIRIKEGLGRRRRAVTGVSQTTGETLSFPSAKEAARYFDSPKGSSCISRAARGKIKTAYGFTWEYDA